MCTISRNKFKRHYLKNKKLFEIVHEIWKILKEKISILA